MLDEAAHRPLLCTRPIIVTRDLRVYFLALAGVMKLPGNMRSPPPVPNSLLSGSSCLASVLRSSRGFPRLMVFPRPHFPATPSLLYFPLQPIIAPNMPHVVCPRSNLSSGYGNGPVREYFEGQFSDLHKPVERQVQPHTGNASEYRLTIYEEPSVSVRPDGVIMTSKAERRAFRA